MDDPTVSIAGGSEPQVPLEGTSWDPLQLLAEIGQGVFGEVYRAWDPQLDREVSLKLLLPQGTDDQAEYDRIVAEARTLARPPSECRAGLWSGPA